MIRQLLRKILNHLKKKRELKNISCMIDKNVPLSVGVIHNIKDKGIYAVYCNNIDRFIILDEKSFDEAWSKYCLNEDSKNG